MVSIPNPFTCEIRNEKVEQTQNSLANHILMRDAKVPTEMQRLRQEENDCKLFYNISQDDGYSLFAGDADTNSEGSEESWLDHLGDSCTICGADSCSCTDWAERDRRNDCAFHHAYWKKPKQNANVAPTLVPIQLVPIQLVPIQLVPIQLVPIQVFPVQVVPILLNPVTPAFSANKHRSTLRRKHSNDREQADKKQPTSDLPAKNNAEPMIEAAETLTKLRKLIANQKMPIERDNSAQTLQSPPSQYHKVKSKQKQRQPRRCRRCGHSYKKTSPFGPFHVGVLHGKAGNVKPHDVCKVPEDKWDPDHRSLVAGERFKPRTYKID